MNDETPQKWFLEKPLRMLYYCRFVTIGLGKVDFETIRAMTESAHKIEDEPAWDIFQEICKLLMTKDPTKGLELMVSTGLMAKLFPEIQTMVKFKNDQGKWHSKDVWQHTLQVVRNSPQILEVRLAALWHDCAKPQTFTIDHNAVHFYRHDEFGANKWYSAACRFYVPGELKTKVADLIAEHMQFPLFSTEGPDHCSDSTLRKFALRMGDQLDNLFYLSMADITSTKADKVAIRRKNCVDLKNRIDKLLEADKNPPPKLPTGLGTILIKELGVTGKELGKVMDMLRERLLGGLLNVDSDFVQEAKNLLAIKVPNEKD
jgi:UTP:GlnB (protein PII) uridylyltransferase